MKISLDLSIKGTVTVAAEEEETPWYLAGGVDAANCVAAYQAKGAASYAASKVNLANPGMYDLEGQTPPSWDASNGWTIPGTLTTNVVVPNFSNISIIMRFSANFEEQCTIISGLFLYGDSRISPVTDMGECGPYGVTYFSDESYAEAISPSMFSGVIGVTKNGVTKVTAGYRNGIADGSPFVSIDGLPDGEPTKFIIGSGVCMPENLIATIQSLTIYSIILDAYQIAAITTAMQAL